jgi:hypothetical protein
VDYTTVWAVQVVQAAQDVLQQAQLARVQVVAERQQTETHVGILSWEFMIVKDVQDLAVAQDVHLFHKILAIHAILVSRV